MDGWMDEWMNGCMDEWMYGCMDGRTDGQKMYGRAMNKETNRRK